MDILGVTVCPGPVQWCTCTTMAENNLTPCGSFTHLIYIYWLLWYNPLITWKADLFLLRTTGASSSFPMLSGGTIPYNTYRPDLRHTLFYCMWENAIRRTFTSPRSIDMRKCLIHDFIDSNHVLLICEDRKKKLYLTLCCFPPSWLLAKLTQKEG